MQTKIIDQYRKKTYLPQLGFFLLFMLLSRSSVAQDSNKVVRSSTTQETRDIQSDDFQLWFKSNGQLFSFPPEAIKKGKKLSGRLVLDENYWRSRLNEILNSSIKAIENMKKYATINKILLYDINEDDLTKVETELAYKITNLINGTTHLSNEEKNFYLKKIRLFNINLKGDIPNGNVPDINSLVEPEFALEYRYYDATGIRINDKSEPYCNEPDSKSTFVPCSETTANASDIVYKSNPFSMPDKCYEIKYELRTVNSLNKVIVAWCNTFLDKFPADLYYTITDNVKQKFNASFMTKLGKLNDDIKKLVDNPMDKSVDVENWRSFVDSGLINTKQIIDRLNNSISNPYKTWIIKWLWLTGGIPKINPFNETGGIFNDGSAGKISAQDKALYQIFDNMVTKGAVKITDLDKIDGNFKNIPKIKAAIDAEASLPFTKPSTYDRLLYQGILKRSADENTVLYMRHLDVLNNYLIMGVNPIREITEKDRMFIMAENKSQSQKFSIAFTTTTIASEDSYFTTSLSQTAGDDAVNKINLPKIRSKNDTMPAHLVVVAQLISLGKKLTDEVSTLRMLALPPTLPLIFNKDDAADFVTLNLAHNYMYDAPATASYSVKTGGADNSDKEVASGTYRINRLYRFRLKAGLVYSFLRKTDYTQTTPGHFTIDNSRFGVDGTFGIQTYFTRQDIRSNKLAWRGFLYTGLSMKKITENFYMGIGIEPVCGIAVGLNAHLGKREALIGSNGIPTAIVDEWGISFAPAITIDPSLFVRLFTFGNTNKSLIGF